MDNNIPTKKSKKDIIMYLSIVLLLTFSFNIIAGHISHLALISLRFFGFILLLAVFLALFPYSLVSQFTLSHIRQDELVRKKVLAVLLVVAACIMLFAASNKVYWMLSFGIFMGGVTILSTLKIEKYALPITVGTFLHIVVYILYMYNSFLFKGIIRISIGFTTAIGRIIAVPITLGPSASGFWIWVYFALCTAGVFFTAKEKSNTKKLILSICGSIVLWAVSIVLYGLIFIHLDIYTLSEVTLLHISLFFMLAGLFFATVHNVVIAFPEITMPKTWKQSAVFLFLFVSAVFLALSPQISNTPEKAKIVFYQRECAMGSYLPEFPEEGESLTGDRGISFGTMLWFFEERGYTVEVLDNENTTSVQEALQNADVFIAANLNEPFSSEEIESIKSFAQSGGGLFLFGEHTNMMADPVDFQSGYHYLNEVLKGTGIAIKSDTAEWTRKHWQTSVMIFPHPVVKGIAPSEIHTGSVGASLSTTGSAQPIMVGRYAFSDDPNPLEPGFLGNRTYEPGELLGDIVLAASSTYGSGKVLVFGDTSYGFNEAIPGTWELMENCIEFLNSEGNSSILEWIGLILFLAAFGVLFSTQKIFINTSAAYAILIISFLISGVASSAMGVSYEKSDAIAWVDIGHCNLINTAGYKDNSVDGLCKNFMRNQYIPLYLTSISQLNQGSILTIIAPTRDYSGREVKKIASFVENGGLLILSVGAMEKNAVKPLLHTFEMDIGNIPLGPVPWIIETHGRTPQISDEDLERYWHEPKFMEVYPVAGAGSVTTYASLTYLGQTYNLIIAKQYGKGMVVLIGDSRYLLDENLEYSLDPARLGKPTFAALWVGNIELLKDIITDYEEELHD